MKINAELVIDLRKSNHWSQEELAIAAGINLRTVQRIECDGLASLQSKKALASAFGIDANDLDYIERPTLMQYEYKVLKFDVKGWFGRNIDSTSMETQLNDYGAEGWDVIKISEILRDAGVTTLLVVTMKRPKTA